jgi:hypothetical protein
VRIRSVRQLNPAPFPDHRRTMPRRECAPRQTYVFVDSPPNLAGFQCAHMLTRNLFYSSDTHQPSFTCHKSTVGWREHYRRSIVLGLAPGRHRCSWALGDSAACPSRSRSRMAARVSCAREFLAHAVLNREFRFGFHATHHRSLFLAECLLTSTDIFNCVQQQFAWQE